MIKYLPDFRPKFRASCKYKKLFFIPSHQLYARRSIIPVNSSLLILILLSRAKLIFVEMDFSGELI